MPRYQKAYRLEQLRRFQGWSEKPVRTGGGDAGGRGGAGERGEGPEDAGLSADTIVYLHEDLTVTASCFDEGDLLFDDVTREWEAFCRDELRFEVPDWKAESSRVRLKLAAMEDGESDREEESGRRSDR